METLKQTLILPNELQQACIDAGVDVARNAENYPLLQREFDDEELAGIAVAKEALLELPLTNSSGSPVEGDILPFVEKPDHKYGHSNIFDAELGLTRCTFMQWGAVEKSGGYGAFHTLIDPKKVLTDPRCFVTPGDIANFTFGINKTFAQFEPDDQRKIIKGYYKKILSGADWLEYQARRVYLETRYGRKAVDLNHYTEFGEIKLFGRITQDMIQGSISIPEEHRVWADLFRKGFIAGPVSRSQPRRISPYDTTPQELGLRGDEAEEFWRALYARSAGSVAVRGTATTDLLS